MLHFTKNGFLIPDNNIAVSVDDLNRYFVEGIPSDTRGEIFVKYLKYSDELKNVLGLKTLKQWINGSFVTKIKNPKDIDLITFVDFDLRTRFANELKQFEAKGANDNFGVDAYLLTAFPTGHEKNFLFESDRAYWMEMFTRTRRDKSGRKHRKGFLEILY